MEYRKVARKGGGFALQQRTAGGEWRSVLTFEDADVWNMTVALDPQAVMVAA